MPKSSLFDNFRFRNVDIIKDKDILIGLECELNYENESYLNKQFDFKEYQRRWYSHGRPQKIYATFKTGCRDKRTICNFMETVSGEKVAFFMVTFSEIKGFDVVYAFLEDIYVYPQFRKQGIGSALLKSIESKAKAAGAHYLSLGTAAANIPSNRLFKKNKYYIYRYGYEKKL